MKLLKIFNRTHRYDFDFEVKSDIEIIKKLKIEICKPQILSYYGLETINFYINDDSSIGRDCIQWIYEQNRDRLNEKFIRECLLKCSVEDKEWTELRNRNLTGTFYRKITFLPTIQKSVCKALDEYSNDLNRILDELTIENNKQKDEAERQKKEWTIAKVYKDIPSSGRENGRDGYFDADYASLGGEIIRMVSRDIFDFGIVLYPKRLEGTDNASDRLLWTESEKQLAVWINEFGKFQKIRM